jgi:hypothetical protein
VLPRRAREEGWPLRHDHCFQRVVLDEVAGTVWYDRIARPAIRNLTDEQAERAASIAAEVERQGEPLLTELNRRSLARRGKL